MPYRGKPSQGCANCRKRKIKCDQRPETCLNCETSNRECPGYRIQRDLMFLDETQQVLKKVRGTKSVSSASRRTTPRPSLPSTLPIISRSQAREDLPVLFNSPRDLEAQAITFYYENFAVKEDPQARWETPQALASGPSHNALYHSMLALGYSGLAQCTPFRELRLKARDFAETAYIEAVRGVKSAVIRAEGAEIDGTLLAVHLMAMYETTAHRRTDAGLGMMMSAWSNHIHGAAALLETRGTAQLENTASMQVFQQTIILLCIDRIKQGLPLPENIFKMHCQAKQLLPERKTPRLRCLDLVVEFCNFFGQVRSKRTRDYQIIIDQAQELDAKAQAVFEHADHFFLYETVPNKPNELGRKHSEIQFPDYHHIYPSFHAAELWNGCRVIRILINQMMRSFLLLGMSTRPPTFSDDTHTQLLQRSTDTLRILQDEVISSLPQYLGLEQWEGYDDSSESDNSSTACPKGNGKASAGSGPSFLWNSWPNTREAYQVMSPRSPTTTISGSGQSKDSIAAMQMMSSVTPHFTKIGTGSNLPWALFTLGATDIATEALKRWLSAQLRYLGERNSVRQALFLADKLEKRDFNEAWYRDYGSR